MTVENLTNFTVPKWLKQKLLSSGITPTNNLLDFQNYILLETGYPFEFYDLDKIYSNLIIQSLI
jgi:phenylalanyl-tRNA synthetase beta chain